MSGSPPRDRHSGNVNASATSPSSAMTIIAFRAPSTSASTPAAPVLTEADLLAQRQRSSACDDAARRYEIAAGSIAPQAELIAARRSTMFAACGIREPDTVQVITNVQTETTRPVMGERCMR